MNMTKMRSEAEGLFHACHDQSGRGVVTRDVADRSKVWRRIDIASGKKCDEPSRREKLKGKEK